MNGFVVQRPTPPNEWLYKDEGENRMFRDYIMRPESVPAWGECTNEEKEQWEREHPEPEPAEVVE